ncbi:MAG: hypothetical protein EHM17_03785 [Verrucomicrobiaceae bacterium]|nr:MAG: hypothetical protein EHM17_03785 [Verrucomicrobiaceae bacterium]
MNDSSNNPSASSSVEGMVHVSLCNARQGIRQRYQACENQIRNCPTTSVLGAVAVGYLLHRLPVRAILVTQVRVLSALAPPALFLFGAAKIYDFLQRRELANRG